MGCCSLQDKIALGYARAGQILGQPFIAYRPNGATDLTSLSPYQIGTVTAAFTNAKASGFNFDKGQGYEDILWSMMADPSGLQPGDFLVEMVGYGGTPRTFFTVYSPPYLPPHAVLCNRTVTQLRSNSQIDVDGGQGEGLPSQVGGSGRYFGTSREPEDDDAGPGERTLARNVPAALVPLAGAARGLEQVPTDSPGPGRWRMYLPVSVFPLGSVKNGDVFTDDQADRYQVATNGWTPLGYKVEMIRLEN